MNLVMEMAGGHLGILSGVLTTLDGENESCDNRTLASD